MMQQNVRLLKGSLYTKPELLPFFVGRPSGVIMLADMSPFYYTLRNISMSAVLIFLVFISPPT